MPSTTLICHDGSPSALFGTVVWACDGGPRDRADFHYVRDLCRRWCPELWIVHVVQTIRPATELRVGEDRLIALLKGRTRMLRLEGIDASLQVIRDAAASPAQAILQLVRDVDADVLILGAHRLHGPYALVSASTVSRLLSQSRSPVLLLGAATCAAPSAAPDHNRLTVTNQQVKGPR